ncbi:unnamed protein product [Meganyctiphanes norvegica]|uniref:RING-type domain-containing protein n=1 Tax=Meganyctiphanes norvegica TaxID=48144 RepID=A0AAV2PYI5_MEGNR
MMKIPECTICFEELNNSKHRPRSLPCGHTVCSTCIEKTVEMGDKTCPNCCKPHSGKLPINYALDGIIKNIKLKYYENISINRKKDLASCFRNSIDIYECKLCPDCTVLYHPGRQCRLKIEDIL